MSENLENTTKTKAEATKIDGISAQINLSPGSETHRRFAEMMRAAGAATARSFIEALMDAYENAAYYATNGNLELEISELKQQLEAANKTANDNAVNGLGKQAQIEELQKQIDGAIIVHPNPVSRFFLEEMAEKQQTTPSKILERLFIDDLQNPRANNLPYTVSASRIREVMKEFKGAGQ